jgi:hypothetical protein
MLVPQWPTKAGDTFFDFGSNNIGSPPGAAVATEAHEFKLGASDHFAPGSLFGHW